MTEGKLAAINVSDGGVPKTARAECVVRALGLEGDRQRELEYHGGPERAVCLFSLDLIEALKGEGHPIGPGAIGENFTLSGVDWSRMTPGSRVSVGEVELELTDYAAPCRTIARAFKDRRSGRVSQKAHPGWSRLYARVTKEGTVRVGDPVRIR
ncbi:MAG TPA: MOSC domain-containing protein [Burkholderiales bacterium]|nr:MOSC domain-containing protein [Burkholderiales bacterium]